MLVYDAKEMVRGQCRQIEIIVTCMQLPVVVHSVRNAWWGDAEE